MDDDLFGPNEPVRLAILGSTGSIGRQALDVVREHPARFAVTALCTGSDAEAVLAQAKEFGARLVGVSSPAETPDPGGGVELVSGPHAAEEIAERCDAQIVLNAVVGAAGLRATLATIRAGKILALANKESLVAAGELVMAKAGPGQIRPVDSEHSALWQLLEGIPPDCVRRVYLTGSGGPFRGRRPADLAAVTVAQALTHPVWDMGPKITIDSASLMNKGLEVIEAHFLFGLTYDEIEVVVHPQGLVHAMAETVDGAVFVHAAPPDMRLPIQIALAWPERLRPPEGKRIGWGAGTSLAFEPPDVETFPCLRLAFEAGRKADTFPAVLNAANEVAVRAFIDERLDFPGIPAVVETVLSEHRPVPADLEGVLAQDGWARRRAGEAVAARAGRR